LSQSCGAAAYSSHWNAANTPAGISKRVPLQKIEKNLHLRIEFQRAMVQTNIPNLSREHHACRSVHQRLVLGDYYRWWDIIIGKFRGNSFFKKISRSFPQSLNRAIIPFSRNTLTRILNSAHVTVYAYSGIAQ
jgi:hypothetical protein